MEKHLDNNEEGGTEVSEHLISVSKIVVAALIIGFFTWLASSVERLTEVSIAINSKLDVVQNFIVDEKKADDQTAQIVHNLDTRVAVLETKRK